MVFREISTDLNFSFPEVRPTSGGTAFYKRLGVEGIRHVFLLRLRESFLMERKRKHLTR